MVERADKFENGYTTVRGIGLGDGGPKIREKVFFGQLSCKIRAFCYFSDIFFGKKCLSPIKLTVRALKHGARVVT